jgi:hypothetical protein
MKNMVQKNVIITINTTILKIVNNVTLMITVCRKTNLYKVLIVDQKVCVVTRELGDVKENKDPEGNVDPVEIKVNVVAKDQSVIQVNMDHGANVVQLVTKDVLAPKANTVLVVLVVKLVHMDQKVQKVMKDVLAPKVLKVLEEKKVLVDVQEQLAQEEQRVHMETKVQLVTLVAVDLKANEDVLVTEAQKDQLDLTDHKVHVVNRGQ